MYEIHYKQIDPDTGRIIREEKMANCESLRMANWIKNLLVEVEHDPNREYSIIEPEKLSLDQIMREYATPQRWDVLSEDENNNLIVSDPNGNTHKMTRDEYEQLRNKKRKP